MTEEQLLAERAKTEWVRTIYLWKQDHLKDYVPTKENDDKIAAYFKAHQFELSYANLEKAFVELKAQGETFTTKPEEELSVLAPVPAYMNGIRTSKDIRDLPPETFRKWRKGPDRDAFFKRLETIKQRGL